MEVGQKKDGKTMEIEKNYFFSLIWFLYVFVHSEKFRPVEFEDTP